MNDISVGDLVSWVKDLGTLGVLLVVLLWGREGKWLWAWQRDRDIQREKEAHESYKAERDREYQRECQICAEYRVDRDKWQSTAMELLQTARVSTGALAQTTTRRPNR